MAAMSHTVKTETDGWLAYKGLAYCLVDTGTRLDIFCQDSRRADAVTRWVYCVTVASLSVGPREIRLNDLDLLGHTRSLSSLWVQPWNTPF